jgi:hypothetical protein
VTASVGAGGAILYRNEAVNENFRREFREPPDLWVLVTSGRKPARS